MSEIAERAESLVRHDDKGGFPPQQQEPPGPDERHGPGARPRRGDLRRPRQARGPQGAHHRRRLRHRACRGDRLRPRGSRRRHQLPRRGAVRRRGHARLGRRAGRTGVLVPGDLVERETCQQVVADAVEGLGGLDILVNNAGYHWDRGPRASPGLEPEHVERVLRTNLHAVIWLTQAAEPHLGPGSSIIMTTSIQAYDPSPALLDYAATKAASTTSPSTSRRPGPQGDPRQRRRSGADLDAAPARDPRQGEDRDVRGGHPAGPRRPARRGRAGLRLPRVAVRRELRLGHRHRRHRAVARSSDRPARPGGRDAKAREGPAPTHPGRGRASVRAGSVPGERAGRSRRAGAPDARAGRGRGPAAGRARRGRSA